MLNIINISTFLIGISYSFLILNKIYFGIVLCIGIILLISQRTKKVWECQKKNLKKHTFLLIFISFFSIISIYNSILPERSAPVLLYFFLIIIFSNFLFFIMQEKIIFNKIIYILFLSTFLNTIIISIYNFSNFDFESFSEIRRFKGFLNIHTLIVLIIPLLYKSKLNLVSLLLLIPNLIMSNSNSPIMGILMVIISISIFYLFQKFKELKKISYILIIIFPILIINFAKFLPNKFDNESIQKFEFIIPIQIIDAHRQFIWGFSIDKFKEKLILGYGPDTSNFISGSQRTIGSVYTGTMNFIPSHPHNFFIELLLEIGIVGTVIFLIILFFYNFKFIKLANHKNLICIIILNSYFWSTSLVNFSFWLGWWQASYFLFLSIVMAQITLQKKSY